MLSSILLLFASIFYLSPFASASQSDWELWKTKTFSEDLTSPTSFLNATSLNHVRSGESLYLPLKKGQASTHWTQKKPKIAHLQAEHLGTKVRLVSMGSTIGYLTKQPSKRRRKIKLANGLIAEVVLGKRVGKLWTYLYNPEQIKKFTGFRFFPYNPSAVVEGVFKKTKRKSVGYKTVQGDATVVYKVGNVSFILNEKETYLSAYSWQKPGEVMRSIALVFVDETSKTSTYPGGRELVIRLARSPKDGEKLELDFNKTINFYCAHSPFWHCPVGLQEPIKTRVDAGEMLPLKKIATR